MLIVGHTLSQTFYRRGNQGIGRLSMQIVVEELVFQSSQAGSRLCVPSHKYSFELCGK